MSELIADFSEDRKADLLKKWSLILSANPAKDEDFEGVEWSDEEETIDKALIWVYGDGGAGSSNRNFSVNDWLREVDFYFPNSVSTVLQKDAIKRYGLELLLKDDAFLEHIVPDIHLAVSILKMKGLLPDVAKHKARLIVKELARKLTGLFAFQTTQAIGKALRSPIPNRRPKYNHINWVKTIYKNLETYQPAKRTIIPERLIGRQNRQKTIDTLFILVDQSGSMHESLVYAAIYASIFSMIPALKTHLVLFDTEVVDLTGMEDDPVEVLFASQLGGGTNIGKALAYAHKTCSNPDRTLMVLISDLDETSDEVTFMREAARVASTFNRFLTILALTKEGKGHWNVENANKFTELGIVCAASTPEQFPELCAREIVLSRSGS
ncbi:MAG TPA: VWA domain-containing protein [Saprospiraceae bacterium]|nr:VWA domain-containing protein [Saprospiraceae bacterium]MBX7178879.1 VWA domain-containing protein [Saprospiraceae bacterium]MCB0591941.1 VWA domain-containing protein [Saprospiraceae bacterium]MCO5283919.1 VWA domain-containing protein [Saprospiraceae bacterium]MCO6469708.1 VWA domain-containing protein [Saprospiraceae bacterium]